MQENWPLCRGVLDELPIYKPGRRVAGPDGRSFKLSSNESPQSPLPSVVRVIAEAAAAVNRYPDHGCGALTEAIADRFGVPAGHIAVGCGSVGVTQQILEAVGEPGAQVVYAWRSFEAYPPLVRLTGAEEVLVPLRDETHDLDAMAAAITSHTRLVLVCNPNNPTGTVVRGGELESSLTGYPDCLVVLDEAYREYVRDAEVPDGLDLYATARTWRCCAPSRRPMAWPGCGSGSWCTITSPRRSARRCCPSRSTRSRRPRRWRRCRGDRTAERVEEVVGSGRGYVPGLPGRAGRCRRPRRTSSGSGWG